MKKKEEKEEDKEDGNSYGNPLNLKLCPNKKGVKADDWNCKHAQRIDLLIFVFYSYSCCCSIFELKPTEGEQLKLQMEWLAFLGPSCLSYAFAAFVYHALQLAHRVCVLVVTSCILIRGNMNFLSPWDLDALGAWVCTVSLQSPNSRSRSCLLYAGYRYIR